MTLETVRGYWWTRSMMDEQLGTNASFVARRNLELMHEDFLADPYSPIVNSSRP